MDANSERSDHVRLGDAFSAGYAKHFAIYLARLLTGQQYVCRRQFDRLARAAKVAVLAEVFDLFVRLTATWLQHSPERTRRNHVGSNALFRSVT